jgi:protein AroM
MDLPGDSNGDYLLTTRLRDGTLVKVQESFLAEKLQNALHRLEAAGVVATILLCAGTFAEVRGTRPLYKPFVLARDTVRLLGMHSLGLIVPIPEQEAPVHARWSRAGFKPHVWTADLGQQDAQFLRNLQRRTEERDLDCIMLDYVGHPAQQVLALQRATSLPVIDLGQLAVTICAGSL